MSDSGFDAQAYLDQLRPDPGWSVRCAFLTAYSADPIAIGATLLALGGRVTEAGSGSAADFAESLEILRGRMRVIIQRGRLIRPSDLPRIAGVLDQLVIERDFDEMAQSWHPKLALVGYESPLGEKSWRLWIGSRNLSRSRDFDIGLLIESAQKRRKPAQRVAGLPELGRTLASLSGLSDFPPDFIHSELIDHWWSPPNDVRLDTVQLSDGTGGSLSPVPPGSVDEFTVVSPFLSDGFVSSMRAWGDQRTERTLVTTFTAVRRLGATAKRNLAGFKLLALRPPEPEDKVIMTATDAGAVAIESVDEEQDSGGSELAIVGLHAKLYAFRQAGRLKVIVGSANATDRAWSGRNAEGVASFDAGPSIQSGLRNLIGGAIPVPPEMLAEPTEKEDAAIEQIDRCRGRLAAHWPLEIARDGDRFVAQSKIKAPLGRSGIRLEVGLATGDLQHWPAHTLTLDLGHVPISLQTDLVHLKLTLEEHSANWLQRVKLTPPLGADRDRAAISSFLGVRGFYAWMRGLLAADTTPDDGTPWERHGWGAKGDCADSLGLEDLTLEDILIGWARDPQAFRRTDKRFDSYVAAILDHDEMLAAKERDALEKLRKVWATAREVLLRE